jgi:hypothetical protein
MLTPSPEEYDFYLTEPQRAGLVRRRWRGGSKATSKGRFYLRDAVQRHDDLRAELSTAAEQWESGAMTKADRHESLAVLVVLAWKLDREAEAEAVAELRSRGYDPHAARDPGGHAGQLRARPRGQPGVAARRGDSRWLAVRR